VLQCIQTRYLTALPVHQSVLQCVAVCCSVLQCVAVYIDKTFHGVAATYISVGAFWVCVREQKRERHDSPMLWLWLVGSIKLQVSFAKEPYKRDAILQKRPRILSVLLTVATSYGVA